MEAIHPGKHLEEKMKEMDMSASELSRQISVPPNRVTQIMHGQRSVSAETALRLAHFFGNSAQFWLSLQSNYDLKVAEKKVGKAIQALPTLKTYVRS